MFVRERRLLAVTGVAVGILATGLMLLGNPPNMGLCVACFLRDIAGGLGLHRAEAVQYLRPELAGLVLGAFLAALIGGEVRASGGSAPLTRFVLGFWAMVGMLVFLGCPLRLVLRLGAGDLNALVGLAGLVAGAALGSYFLRRGFTLGRATVQNSVSGYVFPAMAAVFLVLVFARPAFIFSSLKGPGSQHAPVWIALAAGLVVGALAQRSRLCMVGGWRDFLLFRDTHLLTGFVAVLATAVVGSAIAGTFRLGFAGQPIAHPDALWNFLGMVLAGSGSVLLGGCPLRHLILAGQGNTDSGVTVLGMLAGGAVAYNFGLAASPQGVPLAGKVAVILGLAVVLVLGYFHRERFAS